MSFIQSSTFFLDVSP